MTICSSLWRDRAGQKPIWAGSAWSTVDSRRVKTTNYTGKRCSKPLSSPGFCAPLRFRPPNPLCFFRSRPPKFRGKAVAKGPYLLLSMIEAGLSTFRPITLDMILAGACGRLSLTHVYGSFTSAGCSEREVRRRTQLAVWVGYEQAEHEQR
jgi:hypothetical protein